jgi:hypothetical protein
LYQRALAIVERAQSLLPEHRVELEADDEQGITPEEREEFLAQINSIIAESRSNIASEGLAFSPEKSGSVLPVLINLLAVLAIGASVFFASYFFGKKEQSIGTTAETFTTTEGKLIEALKEETEKELGRKDQEISKIQIELAAMSQEQERLKAEAETTIREKEQELLEALATEVADERRRLQGEGASEEDIERQVEALEARKTKEYEQQVEELRKQAEADLAERESTIASLVAGYEQALVKAQNERGQLQNELESRKTELEAQFEDRRAALESDHGQALEQLDQMQHQQEKERLVQDQILSSYVRIEGSIEAGAYGEALEDLDILRGFLSQDSVMALPGIEKRRPVELFIINSLDQLIAKEQASEQQDTESTTAAATLITSVSSIVDQGNDSFESGDYLAAQELYLSAMAEVPALEVGYSRLEEIEQFFRKQEAGRLADMIASGNEYYVVGDFQKAVEQYGRALEHLEGDADSARRVVARIMEAGYKIKAASELTQLGELLAAEAERQVILKRLRAMRDRYAELVENLAEPEDTRETVSALLETKQLLNRVIDSEEVRAEYPGLFAKTEQYLEAFAEEKIRYAQQATLEDVNRLLEELIDQQSEDTFPVALEQYEDSSQRDLLLKLIDKLQSLIR